MNNTNLTALIKALNIIRERGDPNHPTHCEHDELFVKAEIGLFSETEIADLEELGFFPANDGGGFKSFRFGSC